MFITFEGGEGVGKSTQIALLTQYLQQQGKQVVSTREPGGTDIANKLRAIMLSEEELQDSLLEYTLMAAARRDHLMKVINPSLASGKWVLCDRFYDSSIVYQGLVKQLDLTLMQKIHDILSGGLLPDLTILIDLDPESAQLRIGSREGDLTHYDKKNLDFHHKIRNGFLHLAEKHSNRIKTISAIGTKEEVHLRVIKLLEHR